MRISDWSSDVCSSDLRDLRHRFAAVQRQAAGYDIVKAVVPALCFEQHRERGILGNLDRPDRVHHDNDVERHFQHSRSEEHTSELQSLMRNSYAVFCLKKKKSKTSVHDSITTHYTQE